MVINKCKFSYQTDEYYEIKKCVFPEREGEVWEREKGRALKVSEDYIGTGKWEAQDFQFFSFFYLYYIFFRLFFFSMTSLIRKFIEMQTKIINLQENKIGEISHGNIWFSLV